MLDDFVVRSLLAGIGIAIVTGPAGCFIVWRRLSYFGETIAHSALLGVAIAVILEINLALGIFFTATVIVFAMYYLERRETLPTDTLLGLMSHGALALGLVILSFFSNIRIDLQALLFGDILAVTVRDLAVIWLGGLAALLILWWLWRPLLAATVSTDLATVAGLRPARARLMFGILVAALIAVAIKIVGVLLIVALLIIPAATVRHFSSSPEQMAIRSILVGVVSVGGGLFASSRLDTPSGPSVVVVGLILFVLSWLLSSRFSADKSR